MCVWRSPSENLTADTEPPNHDQYADTATSSLTLHSHPVRCRCAIETMGSLSEQYGFYPSDYEGPINDRVSEAGEVSSAVCAFNC
eukprot:42288-Eustigmatos_ZCMA.PRE.1